MSDQSQIETDRITKEPGLVVKAGKHKLALPIGTILTATLAALGTAYQVVKNDRDAIYAELEKQRKADIEHEFKIQAILGKLEVEQVLMAEIRTQLATLNMRVAEVQVTLMRTAR